MRTTVTLDEDVYRAVTHLSRSSGELFGKVVSRLLRYSLASAPLPIKHSSRHFPTFDVPPDAPIIPASRIEEVIDEEGIF